MSTFNFIAFVLLPIGIFAGAVIWAYGRKRKSRFEADGRIPFEK